MAGIEGVLAANGDTTWVHVTNYGPIHISLAGNFGGGTVTMIQRIMGQAYNIKDSEDSNADITATEATNFTLDVTEGDYIGLRLAGATSPAVVWKVAGRVQAVG